MTEFGDIFELAEHIKWYRNEILIPNDMDWVKLTCGPERTNKSTTDIFLGCYVDPNFNLDNVCMTSKEYFQRLWHAEYYKRLGIEHGEQIVPNYSYLIGDEFGTQAYARDHASSGNKYINKGFIAGGCLNQMHSLIVPKPISIDPYLRKERSDILTYSYYKHDPKPPHAKTNYLMVYTKKSMNKIFKTHKWEEYFWSHEDLSRKFPPDGHFLLPDLRQEIERLRPGLYAKYLLKKAGYTSTMLESAMSEFDDSTSSVENTADVAKKILNLITEEGANKYIKQYNGKYYVDRERIRINHRVGSRTAKAVSYLLEEEGYVPG